MINPFEKITETASNWVGHADMATIGKVACGALMLGGAVLIAIAGSTDGAEETVVETVTDTVKDVVEDTVPAADVIVETVEEVVETVAE